MKAQEQQAGGGQEGSQEQQAKALATTTANDARLASSASPASSLSFSFSASRKRRQQQAREAMERMALRNGYGTTTQADGVASSSSSSSSRSERKAARHNALRTAQHCNKSSLVFFVGAVFQRFPFNLRSGRNCKIPKPVSCSLAFLADAFSLSLSLSRLLSSGAFKRRLVKRSASVEWGSFERLPW